MNAPQAAVLEMLTAVQGFLDEKKVVVAPVNESVARKVLDEVVTDFTAQSVDQKAGQTNSMGETSLQAKLRRQLRVRHMAPIAAVARTVVPQTPEVRAWVVPYAKTPSMQLIAAAGAMADAAQPHEAILIAGGLPDDFIAQLRTAAGALKDSLTNRTQYNGRSQGATRALKPLVERGLATMRVLDSLVTAKLEFSERLLGEWDRVKTVRKKTGPTSGSGAPTTSTPETPPTSIVTPATAA